MIFHVHCQGKPLCGADDIGGSAGSVTELSLLRWDENADVFYPLSVQEISRQGNEICKDCDEMAYRWLALKQEASIRTIGTDQWYDRKLKGDWTPRNPRLAEVYKQLRKASQTPGHFAHLDTMTKPRLRSKFLAALHEIAVYDYLSRLDGVSALFTADRNASSDVIITCSPGFGRSYYAVECKAILDGQRMKAYAENGDEKTLLMDLAFDISQIAIPGWRISITELGGQIFNKPDWQDMERVIRNRVNNLDPSDYAHHLRMSRTWWGIPELHLTLEEQSGQQAVIDIAYLPECDCHYPEAPGAGYMQPSLKDKIREKIQEACNQHTKSKEKHLPLIVALCAEDEHETSLESILYGESSGHYIHYAKDRVPTWRDADGIWSYQHLEERELASGVSTRIVPAASPVAILWSRVVGGEQTLYVPPTSQVWLLEPLMKQIPTKYVEQRVELLK